MSIHAARFALVFTLGLSSTALAFTSVKNGYSISEPKGWQKISGIQGPEIIYADARRESNFNVVTTPAAQLERLDASTQKVFFDAVYKEISGTIQGFKAVSRKTGTLGGQPSLEMVYSTKDGFQFYQVITAYREKSYIITFTSKPARFAKDLVVFNQIKNSFKFTR